MFLSPPDSTESNALSPARKLSAPGVVVIKSPFKVTPPPNVDPPAVPRVKATEPPAEKAIWLLP